MPASEEQNYFRWPFLWGTARSTFAVLTHFLLPQQEQMSCCTRASINLMVEKRLQGTRTANISLWGRVIYSVCMARFGQWGGISGINMFKKGNNPRKLHNCSQERRGCARATTLQTPRLGREGVRGAPNVRAETSLQSVVKHPHPVPPVPLWGQQ